MSGGVEFLFKFIQVLEHQGAGHASELDRCAKTIVVVRYHGTIDLPGQVFTLPGTSAFTCYFFFP
jgi:hypothetical protein